MTGRTTANKWPNPSTWFDNKKCITRAEHLSTLGAHHGLKFEPLTARGRAGDDSAGASKCRPLSNGVILRKWFSKPRARIPWGDYKSPAVCQLGRALYCGKVWAKSDEPFSRTRCLTSKVEQNNPKSHNSNRKQNPSSQCTES